MRRDDLVSSVVDILEDVGADAAVAAIVEAGGHADAEVALLDGELTVAEAFAYAENLLALNATDAACEVIGEAVRAAWGLPIYQAA